MHLYVCEHAYLIIEKLNIILTIELRHKMLDKHLQSHFTKILQSLT